MAAVQEIRCFQHCERDQNILCFSVPNTCPLCGDDVRQTPCRIPPYIIPSPLVRAKEHPCSVVIRPTLGNFLQHYNNQSDLHVGVTDSSGCVYDFNENGINIGAPWEQCVAINMVNADHYLKSRWDSIINQLTTSYTWHKSRYNEWRHNCFDFVLAFLQSCNLPGFMTVVQNKHTFCQELVVKHTHRAAVYITLYRCIQNKGFSIQNVTSKQERDSVY